MIKPIKADGINKFLLDDILEGKHPQYPTNKLKHRLYKAGIKKEKCECCGIDPIWNGKLLVMQLDHIDGNHTNHKLENLAILCPNCHTQTDTWAGKKRKINCGFQ